MDPGKELEKALREGKYDQADEILTKHHNTIRLESLLRWSILNSATELPLRVLLKHANHQVVRAVATHQLWKSFLRQYQAAKDTSVDELFRVNFLMSTRLKLKLLRQWSDTFVEYADDVGYFSRQLFK